MTISVIPIERCFGVESEDIVPSFDFLEIEDPTFRLLRMQCRGDVLAHPEMGVRNASELHEYKCREALKLARAHRADIFLTPEYAIPLPLIDEIICTTELQPHPNKLWCLCCEGVPWEIFEEKINEWSDRAYVGKKALEEAYRKNFAGFLLYLFQSKRGDKLCIVPQLKLQPMREDIFVCEGDGLSRGKHVVLFGDQKPNQLVSIICADAFHPDLKDSSKFFPGGNERKLIILHPQMNPAPRNGELASLRNNLFSQEWGNSTIYITANWAAGSAIFPEQMPGAKHVVQTPWSSIYRRFHNYGGDEWAEKLRSVRNENIKHGLGFAFEDYKKYKVWFAHKNEHLQLLVVRKPYGGGPSIVKPSGTVQASKLYLPNERNDGWEASTLHFQTALPDELAQEATGEFAFPVHASVEERDEFFGLCLGHLEKGELVLSGSEQCSRISYHIDDACEPGRVRQADRVANLIRILKSERTLPAQLRKLQGGYQFMLAKETPFNLIPKSGNEKGGALVSYVERESEMIKTAEGIWREIPYGRQLLGDSICVFARKATGELTHYPQVSEEFTSPDRVENRTDISHGGVSIEQPFD